MKMGTLIVALVVAGVNIAGIVWLTGGGGVSVADKSRAPDPEELPISETGPWPKAVVPDPDYNFDVMAVGAKKSHKFVIKNEGDVPLKYKLKGTSCSCTVSDMENEKIYEIPAGEEKEVELTWNPTEPEDQFGKYAELYTNDPDKKLISLTIRGRVERLLSMNPEGGWPLREVERDKPQTVTGEIFSAVLDEITIEKVDVSSDAVKATYEAMSPSDLEEHGAKSGYWIKAVLDPSKLKVGTIDEKITVHTDVEGAKEIPFALSGQFLGPITAVPYRPEGAPTRPIRYHTELLHLDIGQFPASEGGKGWYKLAIANMPEGLEFEAFEIEPSLKNVKVTVERLPSPPQATGRQFALVTFEVLPGVATGTYQKKNSVKITMKTNHPKAEELKFYLEFIAI